MSHSPSAPPPSYDDIYGNNSQNYKHQNESEIVQQPPYNNSATQIPINYPHQPQPPVHQHPVPVPGSLMQPQILCNVPPQQRSEIIVQDVSFELGPFPVRIICPLCHQSTLTRVEHKNTVVTHAVALLFCLTGLFLCSCLPYCFNLFKRNVHYCRKCGEYIGFYQHRRYIATHEVLRRRLDDFP